MDADGPNIREVTRLMQLEPEIAFNEKERDRFSECWEHWKKSHGGDGASALGFIERIVGGG